MAREILFRGKRIDNGEWIEGDLIQLHDGRKFIINSKFGACIDNNGNFINVGSPFVCEVVPESVGQYTGLVDIHGKKIFEGDIINGYTPSGVNEFRNAVVRWSDLFVGWRAGNSSLYGGSIGDLYEVIGNIHDNPELLMNPAQEE